MAQPSMDYVKTIIRSVLTSSPSNVTVSQVLLDYTALEGENIPFRQLGFNTVYDLLQNMNDVLEIPYKPNMFSPIKLIVDERTAHLRELIVNQKSNRRKRTRTSSKKNVHNLDYNRNLCSKTNNANVNNYDGSNNNYNTHRHVKNPSARGYDYIKNKSVNSSRCKGFVTNDLRKCIEDLLFSQTVVKLPMLKDHLISHPDYKKLQTSNIEDSINMLKYFIYIDKGGVHLKNSSFEILPATGSNTKNDIKPVSSDIILPYIVDEAAELSWSNNDLIDDDIYGFMEDDDINNTHEPNSSFEILPAIGSNTKNDIKPVSSDIILPYIVDEAAELSWSNNDLIDDDIYGFMENDDINNTHEPILNKIDIERSDVKMYKNENNELSKASKVFNVIHPWDKDLPTKKHRKRNTKTVQAKKKNNSITSTKQPNFNIGSNKKLEEKTVIPVDLKKDDYNNMIVSIIKENVKPITVKEVLANFNKKHGYGFPFQKFSCRTCMDYFRLYPAIFKLDDQFSTNSIIYLNEQAIFNRSSTIRCMIMKSSIFNIDNLDRSRLVQDLSEFDDNHQDNDHNYSNQDFDEPIEETHCKQSIHACEIFDSDMILDSMKEKMRCVLNKYPNGILYNEFMDIYAMEYQSYFTFSEYGFKSMRDMAYNLPSVFYVKTTEDKGECILYNADRRNELQNNFNDPLLYYKNIPKTVLHNLSMFFDEHRSGISFDKLMAIYCSQFGRSYEPLKYGYSSEKHMFESLDKMVKIENNVLYTLDPFAYTYFVKNKDYIEMYEPTVKPVDNSLINYSGSDASSLSFAYKTHRLEYNKKINIIVAEIYNPSLFYVHLASTVESLKSLMINLQSFYTKNEHKYKILPELLTVKLACTTCFESSMQWHRARITKLIDEHNVEVLYVDYGSIEIIAKSKIRVLDSEFKSFPKYAIQCSLHEFDTYNYTYTRDMNEFFATIVDRKILEATFHKLNLHEPEKKNVTLYIKEENTEVNINMECVRKFENFLNKGEAFPRRSLLGMLEREKNMDFKRLMEWTPV